MLTPLAQRTLDAYGGEDRWRNATAVECRLSAHGWALRLKLRPAMKDVLMWATLAGPHHVMVDWPNHGQQAVLDGPGEVRIETKAGYRLASRKNPRQYFPGGRRTFRWDDLDQAYFAGYAAWNYLTFPALLLREDIAWSEVSKTTLEARFPDSLPTHSAVQRFHIDAESGLLRQHDYTAEVFGGWAKAANVVEAHGEWEGIPYPSRRKVTPRKADGTPRGFPLLVGIKISDWRLV
ncbi:MAG TPA: hypothetical protein VIW01_08960 [Dehalococcoidia bacterium]